MRFKRADRVGGQVRKELSELLVREVRDPRLDSVTIVGVTMTDDLRFARVYFSIGGGEDRRKDAIEGFKSAYGFLRRELSRRMKLRYMPELKFHYDVSFDRAERLNHVFKGMEHGEKEAENK